MRAPYELRLYKCNMTNIASPQTKLLKGTCPHCPRGFGAYVCWQN